jgi:saccharopine dehydrogenase (NAD+, L-lysine-forming)
LQRAGRFRLVLEATSASGEHAAMVAVQGRGDPGYLATSKIFGEVGLCLVLDNEEAPGDGGVLTPWLALGSVLRERLVAAENGEFMQFQVLAES